MVVTLLDTRVSLFGMRVRITLEEKGVKYYSEQDLRKFCFYETGHDEQDKYIWMISQGIDNLNESYYILEKHKKTNQNLTYEHCMDKGMGSRETQRYEEKHN
jgi:hypothetical protein